MMDLLRKSIVIVLRSLRNLLLSRPKFRALIYDMYNKEEFGNLYEHEKMLADSVRINHYRKAIRKHIGPEDTVLDLGTGTGILSFFAAQQKARKICALDHSNFIEIARKVAEHNNFQNIEFIQTNSRDFRSDIKFDVIIHEQIGDYLFNENMIQNILDLKKRLLKPNGRILPGKFELFVEPACLEESFNIPFIWENELYGVDFQFLREYYESLDNFKPVDYTQEWIEAAAVKRFLCEPVPILAFDLNTLNSEQEIPHVFEMSKTLTTSGSFDGFCLYFKVIFDEEIHFDTSPLTPYTHWGNCFFRIESRQRFAGDIVTYRVTIQDLLDIKRWSVSVKRFEERGRKQS